MQPWIGLAIGSATLAPAGGAEPSLSLSNESPPEVRVNPAPCSQCGATVLTYRRFVLHLRPTATCPSCGRTVRVRGFRWQVGGGVVMLGIALGALFLLDSLVLVGITLAALLIAGVMMDRWSWIALPWDPVDEAEPAEAREPASAGPTAPR